MVFFDVPFLAFASAGLLSSHIHKVCPGSLRASDFFKSDLLVYYAPRTLVTSHNTLPFHISLPGSPTLIHTNSQRYERLTSFYFHPAFDNIPGNTCNIL